MRYYLKQKPPDTVLFQSKKYRVRVVFIYTEVVGCLKSVSYTHLDVYKRQHLSHNLCAVLPKKQLHRKYETA